MSPARLVCLSLALLSAACAAEVDAVDVSGMMSAPLGESEPEPVAPAAPTAPAVYTVRIDPLMDDERVTGILYAINAINIIVGQTTMKPIMGELGGPADWTIRVHATGLDDTDNLGWAGWDGTRCDVKLRHDARDQSIFMHEALHCFGLWHVEDRTNVMYPASIRGALQVTPAQAAEARAHLASESELTTAVHAD